MKKILYFLVALLLSKQLFAQNKTWVGGNSSGATNWNLAANWNPSGVPASTDDVIINIGTNDPIVSSGVNAVAKTLRLSGVGSGLTVDSGASLAVSTNSGNVISISNGIFNNNGTLTATNTNPINAGNNDIIIVTSNGVFNNAGTATFTNGDNTVITLNSGRFNNLTNGVITATCRDVFRMSGTNTMFTNNLGASFKGTGTNIGLFMQVGIFNNYGDLELVGQVEIYGATSNIRNFACARMKVTANFFVQSSAEVSNQGVIQILGNLNSGGNFNNNGVLVANAYPSSGYVNGGLQINNNAANNALFTLSNSLFTINGIFFDQAATQSAGTYVARLFTPEPMAGGVRTLYLKATNGSCVYVVPFSYTRPRSRWYINTTASGSANGTSWANASNDIQAIINGSVPYDSLWIAAGVYKPLADASGNTTPTDARRKIFYLKSGLKMLGGFAGTETAENQRDFKTNRTILSGDIDNNDTNTDGNNIAETSADIQGNNVYQLLIIARCDKLTQVDGLLFTGAKSSPTPAFIQTVNGSSITPDLGSAIHITASYPTIQNCVFSGNFGGNFGNVYQNNVTTTYVDTVKVVSSIFTGNYAQYGGGMFIRRGHHYSNNVAMYNNTSEYGGALIVQNNMNASGTIDFVNTTFVNNYSTSGKSINIEAGTVKLLNSIVHNTVPYSGGNVEKSGGTLDSRYSLLQNSLMSGTWNNNYGTNGGNNLDTSPIFTNIADIDGVDNKFFTVDDGLSLSLCPTASSGLNAGINEGVLQTDITSSPRIFADGITDIGAYELQRYSVSANINLTANISAVGVVHASSNTIVATNKVLSSANAQYWANNSILLNAGFEASNGAVFVAKIIPLEGCN